MAIEKTTSFGVHQHSCEYAPLCTNFWYSLVMKRKGRKLFAAHLSVPEWRYCRRPIKRNEVISNGVIFNASRQAFYGCDHSSLRNYTQCCRLNFDQLVKDCLASKATRDLIERSQKSYSVPLVPPNNLWSAGHTNFKTIAQILQDSTTQWPCTWMLIWILEVVLYYYGKLFYSLSKLHIRWQCLIVNIHLSLKCPCEVLSSCKFQRLVIRLYSHIWHTNSARKYIGSLRSPISRYTSNFYTMNPYFMEK